MAHTFFNGIMSFKGGFNGHAKNLIYPFNTEKIENIIDLDSDPYFDTCLYKNALPAEKQKEMNFMCGVSRAISRLVMPSIDDTLIGFGGFGYDQEGNFYADYWDGTAEDFNTAYSAGMKDFSNSRHILFKIDKQKEMSAVVTDDYLSEKPYMLWTDKNQTDRHSSSAAIFALLAYIVSSVEKGSNLSKAAEVMYSHYNDIIESYMNINMDKFAKAIRCLENDFYTAMTYDYYVEQAYGSKPIEPSLFDKEIFDLFEITKDKTELVEMKGNSAFLGGTKSMVKNTTKLKAAAKKINVKELADSKEFDLGLNLTDEEELLVPTSLDDVYPDDIVVDTAREIKISSNDPIPARNFLWTGESGTGKTTSAKMLARLNHLAYRSMNLSSDKQSSDILVNCLPNTNKLTFANYLDKTKNFPDSSILFTNTAKAYEMVTGRKKEDATEQDVRNAEEKVRFDLLNNMSDFMYVDSPFVTTFRNGGVIELQEVNAAKPGILKALNEALDDLNILHLPTGEVIHRNPNCVVVVTANVGQGYEGINAFSNDFIARFHQADVFELPDDKELCQRVMATSNFDNEKIIMKMVKVMHAMQRVLLESKGDYGACSPRALFAWARKTKNCGDAYLSGVKTIVNLSSQDPEIKVELLHALETEFVPTI